MLKPDKIIKINDDLKIKQKIIPYKAKWNKCYKSYKKGDLYKADKKMKECIGITIHNTNPLNTNDDAEQYALATWNQNMGDARVHYYVSEKSIWQLLEDDEIGWHAGTGGNGQGNINTIAIEIIGTKAEDNGARLVAYLMKKYNFSLNNIFTHNHWMGLPDKIVYGVRKNCPIYILQKPDGWKKFKELCEKYYESKNNEEVDEMRYNKLEDIKNSYYKEFVKKLTNQGIIKGDSNGNLDLTDDMIRTLIFVDRIINK